VAPEALIELIAGRLAARKPAAVPAEGMRRAAVIVPLFFRGGEAFVLFTQRTLDVPTHKGQISFPGGVVEPDDDSLLAAALRETFEEVGIPPKQVQVLGQLDDMPTSSAPFVITPFVGVIPEGAAYVTSDREVARILEVPLEALLDASLREVDARSGTWQYRWQEDLIWGATARMLTGFLGILVQPFDNH
jgi:8-oxo-dGTP pyrophosphatase MutT (NUDIX family)